MKRLLLTVVAAFTLATSAQADTDPVAEFKQIITGGLDAAQRACSHECDSASIVLALKPQLDVMLQSMVRVKLEPQPALGCPMLCRPCDKLREWAEDAVAEWVMRVDQ